MWWLKVIIFRTTKIIRLQKSLAIEKWFAQAFIMFDVTRAYLHNTIVAHLIANVRIT